MSENKKEDLAQAAKEKAEQAKSIAEDTVNKMKNISADEAKKIASEKAEQAKKIASEKMDQIKNISADEAKKKMEDSLNTFNQMPVKQKAIFGSIAAIVLIGLLSIFSGTDETSTKNESGEEVKLFTHNGECAEGELIDATETNGRTVSCEIEEGSKKNKLVTLKQELYADGNVKVEDKFHIVAQDKSNYTSHRTILAGHKEFFANGDIKKEDIYTTAANSKAGFIPVALSKIEKHPNGKTKVENLYAGWVYGEVGPGYISPISTTIYNDNGDITSKTLSEIKNNSGKWVYLKTFELKSSKETKYEVKEDSNGIWDSYKVEVKHQKGTRFSKRDLYTVETYVIKENVDGSLQSHLKTRRSKIDGHFWDDTDENDRNEYGFWEEYEIVLDNNKWTSLQKRTSMTRFNGAKTNYTQEYTIKKNKISGKHESLIALRKGYGSIPEKGIFLDKLKTYLQSETKYDVVEQSDGSWKSLETEKVRYDYDGKTVA